jgi:hypothetical protein
MLLEQRGNERAMLTLEPREHEGLLQLLVMLFDERLHDPCSTSDPAEVGAFTALEPSRDLVIDQQHPLDDPVILHQILTGRAGCLALRGSFRSELGLVASRDAARHTRLSRGRRATQ